MGKSWKDVTSSEEIKTITVQLRSLAGIQPIVYVPILWAVIIAIVLFLILLLPGVRSYGTILNVESSPAGAQVLVDGVLQGSTPLETFVPAGERSLEVRLAGFDARAETLQVGGRRIASAIFPLRETVAHVFTAPDRSRVIERTLREFSSWALSVEPGAQFQHPPVARDGARKLWATRGTINATEAAPTGAASSSTSTQVSTRVQNERSPEAESDGADIRTLTGSLLAHGESHQSADILGAIIRLSNPGGIVNGGSLVSLVRLFAHNDKSYQGFHRVLGDLDAGGTVERTEWFRAREDQLTTDLLAASVVLDEYRPQNVRRRSVNGLSFVAVEGGVYAIGYPLRDEAFTGVLQHFDRDFWIQADEVNRASFARFLSESPEWEPGRRPEEDYLKDWPSDWRRWLEGSDPAGAALPVRYVTREAAQAFARWVDEKNDLPGESVRLPSAAEWEYAAFYNDPDLRDTPSSGDLRPTGTGPVGALGAHRMTGSLWEWTRDWYGRYGHVVPAYHGSQAVVMGGSFANSALSHSMRGSQPPDRPTPFLGFRLAIVPEVP
jgi:gamma-glutamyl hercynylcysteine S-oxide synthase